MPRIGLKLVERDNGTATIYACRVTDDGRVGGRISGAALISFRVNGTYDVHGGVNPEVPIQRNRVGGIRRTNEEDS